LKKLTSHFKFNAQERSGIFFLLITILALFCALVAVKRYAPQPKSSFEIHTAVQEQIEELKVQQLKENTISFKAFNPNYISEYKGYVLGLSTEELDRLHQYRSTDKFVNSATEFQAVTLVSDSTLIRIAPYFKFPKWTKNKRQYQKPLSSAENEVLRAAKDLNTATALELQEISGIGTTLSARIVKFRDRLGGFFSETQLLDVYGLSPEVVAKTQLKFKVLSKPDIPKINVNQATVEELSKLIYIPEYLAQNIVDHRQVNGRFLSLTELTKIDGFPSDKIDRIALYLSL